MGYYTKYALHWDERVAENERIIDHIEDTEMYYAWTGDQEPCKWYEHDEDLRALSRVFPAVTFFLIGEGEEGVSDVWKKAYRNGKRQVMQGKIVFEVFDPKGKWN